MYRQMFAGEEACAIGVGTVGILLDSFSFSEWTGFSGAERSESFIGAA